MARPERRTALIAKELQHYNIDITVRRETRLADEGSLKEAGGDSHSAGKGNLI